MRTLINVAVTFLITKAYAHIKSPSVTGFKSLLLLPNPATFWAWVTVIFTKF
jgi:hypothetical protein